MALLSARKLRWLGGLIVLALAVGGGMWWQRERILAWHYLRGLTRANEAERNLWAGRVASLGEVAVPGLLDCLARDDERMCANARAALEQMCAGWPLDDPRRNELAGRIVEAYPRLSEQGQHCVLGLAGGWVQSDLQPYSIKLVSLTSESGDSGAHVAALDIAAMLLADELGDDGFAACRALACICLRDGDASNRRRAVQFALYPQLNLLDDVIPLLSDPSPEVRRCVVLAVGGSRQALSDERLAVALHDSDAEVRRLCEKALLGRGLTRRHIHLARLITDRRPAIRLQVLYYLREDSDLDVAVWLRLLTQDSAEAVRLAAVRATAEQTVGELRERLEQMTTSDPSPTVCRWARYYLGCLKQRQASNALR
jgi:HEAT repeat protein